MFEVYIITTFDAVRTNYAVSYLRHECIEIEPCLPTILGEKIETKVYVNLKDAVSDVQLLIKHAEFNFSANSEWFTHVLHRTTRIMSIGVVYRSEIYVCLILPCIHLAAK